MDLKQNGRSWTAEITAFEVSALIEMLPGLLEPAGRVLEIRPRELGKFWIEVDLELEKPVVFDTPSENGSVWINRDGGGVSYDGCRNWYRPGLYPMPMPGDTKITIRLYLSVNGHWWPEEGPESRDVQIEDVHELIAKFAAALAVGWDPIGEPRSRH